MNRMTAIMGLVALFATVVVTPGVKAAPPRPTFLGTEAISGISMRCDGSGVFFESPRRMPDEAGTPTRSGLIADDNGYIGEWVEVNSVTVNITIDRSRNAVVLRHGQEVFFYFTGEGEQPWHCRTTSSGATRSRTPRESMSTGRTAIVGVQLVCLIGEEGHRRLWYTMYIRNGTRTGASSADGRRILGSVSTPSTDDEGTWEARDANTIYFASRIPEEEASGTWLVLREGDVVRFVATDTSGRERRCEVFSEARLMNGTLGRSIMPVD